MPWRPPLLNPDGPSMQAQAPDSFKVLFETSAGDFVITVIRALAPAGADRFHNLVRHGFYDGVRFFRVVTRFVVQFGIPGDTALGAAWQRAPLPDDPVRTSNNRGTITFASAGPDTRTTQLFINLAENARLDALGFAPIGRVTGGMDVVERFYSGYGEMAPSGPGPNQGRIIAEGDRYLGEQFPRLDRILRARVLDP